MPGFDTATVEPARKLDPEIVTGTAAFRAPLLGEREVIVGTGSRIENGIGALVPPGVWTTSGVFPGTAPEATVNVAVNWVGLTAAMFEMETFGPAFSTRL